MQTEFMFYLPYQHFLVKQEYLLYHFQPDQPSKIARERILYLPETKK